MFLLVQTDRSVTEICLDVGFTSLGTFSRTFRAIVGESPTSYRARGVAHNVPNCFAMAWTRPSSFGEANAHSEQLASLAMLNITHSSIYVLDQDEALDFYVGKLGLEVNTDVDMGFMRWLTVSVPGEPDREILLERPGPPAHDDATAEQVRELVTKGATGFALGLRTDDCRKTYEELRPRASSSPRSRPSALRHRLRPARPVRQPHPHRAARAGAARSARPRGVRPELSAWRSDARRRQAAHQARRGGLVADPAPPEARRARCPGGAASPAHFSREFRARVRRDPAPLPAHAAARARRRRCCARPTPGGRQLHDVGLRSVGSFTTSFGRMSARRRPPIARRSAGVGSRAGAACVLRAWGRPAGAPRRA